MLPLKTFRSKKKAVSDLLNFAALVDDGVVQCKSGALIAGFYYRGRDLQSCTVEERNYVTGRVNAALARLGSGWVSWHDAVRIPSPAYTPRSANAFRDPITALIDEERRELFEGEGAHFESEYALILQFMPPKQGESAVANLVYEDDAVPVEARLGTWERIKGGLGFVGSLFGLGSSKPSKADEEAAWKHVEHFKAALTDLEDFLGGDVLRLRRMKSFEVELGNGRKVLRDDLVTYLHYCVSGTLQPINIPACPMYLDALIGGQELHAGDTPKIGEQFVAAVSIEGFPGETSPNMLDALDNLAIPYRWSSRFIHLDSHEAVDQLGRFRRHWKQKERGFWSQVFRTGSGQVNEDAVMMRRTAEVAINDAQSQLVTFGFYTPVVVLFAASRAELDDNCRQVVRTVRQVGFAARRETINTMEAWLGAVPGHAEPNVRRPMIHTLNLADLVPLSSVWPGRPVNPCPYYPPGSPPLAYAATNGATPYRLNLHVDDLGHTLIFGPTGAGKSTLLGFLVAQFRRYRNAHVLCFDKGRSMLLLASAAGGRHYDLANEGDGTGFCPLQHLDSNADASWAEEWIGTCYELQAKAKPTPHQKEQIHRAIVAMRKSPLGRSLTDFVTTVQDEAVRAALRTYTLEGNMGHLLDAERDGLKDDPFSVFELDELMELGEANILPVLLYLFRRIEKSLKGQSTLLVLDEAWLMLGHPVFAAKVREWLKTLRRANCAVILATQSLSDAARSPIFDVLVESCPTKILLPNEEADKRGVEGLPGPWEMYTAMGLNATEIQLLTTSVKKRHYYVTSPEGRRLIDLALGPIALSFLAVNDRDNLARVRRLVEEFGEAWPFVWLEQRKVSYERFIEPARVRNVRAA